MYANIVFVNPFNEEEIEEYAYVQDFILPRDGDLVTLQGKQYKVQGVAEFDYDVFNDDPPPGRVAIVIRVKPSTFKSYGS